MGDQGPEGRIGGEDVVVTVAVDMGLGENLGQPVQELESREPEGGTARGIGPRKQIEDLVGATVDKVETIESEKRPGAIPDGVAP